MKFPKRVIDFVPRDDFLNLAIDAGLNFLQRQVGPWRNDATTPCGGPDVLGHRHDQTALSVIAARAGCKLTEPPEFFAYGKHTEAVDPRVILLADGAY